MVVAMFGAISGPAAIGQESPVMRVDVTHITVVAGPSSDKVSGVTVTEPGLGYLTTPAVTFSAPTGSGTLITATGTARMAGGTLVGVDITNPGSGYTDPPTVTIDPPPPASGPANSAPPVPAKATAFLGGQVFAANTNPAGPNEAFGPAGIPINITARAIGTNTVSSFRYDYFVNGVGIGYTVVPPPNSATYPAWTPPRPGVYFLSVTASDGSNSANSPSVRYFATGAEVVSPLDNSLVPVGSSVTIKADATPERGFIRSIEFFDGTRSLGVDVTAPYSLNYTPTAPAGSVLSITVVATDSNGGTIVSPVTSLNMVPAVGLVPTVQVTSPADNSVIPVPNGNSIPISVTANDADGRIDHVEIYVDGVLFLSDTTFPYLAQWTPTAVGNYRLSALAFDDKNNVVTSAINTVLISAPPAVAISSPVSGAAVSVGSPVTVSVSAADSDGAIVSVRLFDGDTFIAEDTTAPYSFTWTPSDGTSAVLTAVAIDNVDLSTVSEPVTLKVNGAGGDGSPNGSPTATIYRGSYSGSTHGGLFSFSIGSDGKASLFAYSTEPAGTIFQQTDISVAADGSFSVVGSGGTPTLSGRVAETGVSGTFPGGTFIGPVVVAGSNPRFPSAIFRGGLTGASGSSATATVGADGTIFIIASNGTTSDAASGTIGSNGAFSLTSPSGHRFAGSYTAATGTVGGVITGPALNTGFVLGLAKGRLLNISSRAVAGSGNNVLIAGFRVFGAGSRELLIRGVGPSLENFGLTGVIANPNLSIYNSAGAVLATNDNWTSDTAMSSAVSRVSAFAMVPNSADAAVLTTLQPGNYTAVLGGGTGIGLIEIYDAGAGSESGVMLSNLSTRGQVGTNDKIMITGFVVGGDQPRNFLIRAVGPTLANVDASLGAAALKDPRLTLLSGSRVVRENDDWNVGDTAATVATYTPRVGAFALPAGSKDAAIAVTLNPGAYTVQVSGVGATTGVVLVEVYDVSAVQ